MNSQLSPLNLPSIPYTKYLAHNLNLCFDQGLEKVESNESQQAMLNSFQPVKDIDGTFEIITFKRKADNQYTSCLLIDDIIDSS